MGLLIRAIWFVFIGWWLAILWFLAGLALMATIVFFPVGAYVLSKTWAVMTLKTKPTVVIEQAPSSREE